MQDDYTGLGRVLYDYNGEPKWIPFDENNEQDMKSTLGPLIEGATESPASILAKMPDIEPADVHIEGEIEVEALDENYLQSGMWLIQDLIRKERNEAEKTVINPWSETTPENMWDILENDTTHIDGDEDAIAEFLLNIDRSKFSNSAYGKAQLQKYLEESDVFAEMTFPWEREPSSFVDGGPIRDKAMAIFHDLIKARYNKSTIGVLEQLPSIIKKLTKKVYKNYDEKKKANSAKAKAIYDNFKKEERLREEEGGWSNLWGYGNELKDKAYDWMLATQSELKKVGKYKDPKEFRREITPNTRTAMQIIQDGFRGTAEDYSEYLRANGAPEAERAKLTRQEYEKFMLAVDTIRTSAWRSITKTENYKQELDRMLDSLINNPKYEGIDSESLLEIAEFHLRDSDTLGYNEELFRYARTIFGISAVPGEGKPNWGAIEKEYDRVNKEAAILQDWELLQIDIPRQRDKYIVDMANQLMGGGFSSVNDVIAYTSSLQGNTKLSREERTLQYKIANKIFNISSRFVSTKSGEASALHASYKQWSYRQEPGNPQMIMSPGLGNLAVFIPGAAAIRGVINRDPWAIRQQTETFAWLNKEFYKHYGNIRGDRDARPMIGDRILTIQDITGIDPTNGASMGQFRVFRSQSLGTDANGDEQGYMMMQWDPFTTQALIRTIVAAEKQTPSATTPAPLQAIGSWIGDIFRNLAMTEADLETRTNLDKGARDQWAKNTAMNTAVMAGLLNEFGDEPEIKNYLMSSMGIDKHTWNQLRMFSRQYVKELRTELGETGGRKKTETELATILMNGEFSTSQLMFKGTALDMRLANLIAMAIEGDPYDIGDRTINSLNTMNSSTYSAWMTDDGSIAGVLRGMSIGGEPMTFTHMIGTIPNADYLEDHETLVPASIFMNGDQHKLMHEQFSKMAINMNKSEGIMQREMWEEMLPDLEKLFPNLPLLQQLKEWTESQHPSAMQGDNPIWVPTYTDIVASKMRDTDAIPEYLGGMSSYGHSVAMMTAILFSNPRTSPAMRAAYTAYHKEQSDIIQAGGTISVGDDKTSAPSINTMDLLEMVTTIISDAEQATATVKDYRNKQTGQTDAYNPNELTQGRVEPEDTADKYQVDIGEGLSPTLDRVITGTIAPEDNEQILERVPAGRNQPGRNNFLRASALQRAAVGDPSNPYGGYGIPHSERNLLNFNEANWFMHWNPMNIRLIDGLTYRDKLNGPNNTEDRSAAALYFYYGKNPKYARTMLLDNLQIDSSRINADGQYYHRFYTEISSNLGKTTAEGEEIWNKAVSVLTNDLLERIQETVLDKVKTEAPWITRTPSLVLLAGGELQSKHFGSGEITTLEQANKHIPTTGDQHYYIIHEILKAIKGTSDNKLLTNIISARPDIFDMISRQYGGLLDALNGSANVREGFTRYSGPEGFEFSRLKTTGYKRDDSAHLKYPQGTLMIKYDANNNPFDTQSDWMDLVLPWNFEDRYYPEILDTEYKQWKKDMIGQQAGYNIYKSIGN
jgi:hypothetical protein